MDLPWSLQEASYFGFIKDFASFIMKNIHPFNVYRSVSIYTPIVFANISVSMPAENYIISLVFSLAQVNSVFNGTDTIALLGPKIWDLVLLEAKPKKYVNIFKNTITCKYYTTCIV